MSTCTALPVVTNAAQVAGDALEVYGKAHISLDSVSAKDSADQDISNLSISSNSSRLGFKGKAPVGTMTGFYKIEGSISFENSGGAIDHRAAYAGLGGDMGRLLLGYRDTPFKDIRGKFDVFGDTVGDARNIIGSIGGNIADKRAKNALMYTTPKSGGIEANIMYSTAWEGDSSAQAGQDNNNNALISANLVYTSDALTLAAGMEKQKHVDSTVASPTLGDTTNTTTATRVVGTYKIAEMRVGLIFENLDDDKSDSKKRSAYGANFVMNAGATGKIKLQYIKAGDTDAVNDSGATEIAAGYDYKLDKISSTYIAYSTVSNDKNAAYVMGNGHDQKYTTATGENVSAISAGYIIKF